MRIIHLLKHAVRGNGHVHVAVDLACAQADAGHEVWFASARGSYDDLLRHHGVRVQNLPESIGIWALLKNATQLLKLTLRVRPDVLHAHMMSSALAAYPVGILTRSPVITTVHNSFDAHSRLMRLGKFVVAVSESDRQLLISRGFARLKVVTILNGGNNSPREQLPRDYIGNLYKPAVIAISGLHPRKATDDIISAFSLVHEEFPHWHLNIVGSGPSLGELKKQASNLGITEKVHFLGSTLTPRYLLDQAEIFTTASLAEPCGLNNIEARGSGCALIGTDVGGIPEVFEHGRAGQLVPPRDPSAMAEALRRLMGDPFELASWQERSRNGAQYFSVERMALDYCNLYLRAITSRRSLKRSHS